MDTQHIDYEKLIAFAADELDPSEAHVVAMHIASCAECSQSVTHFRSIRRWMRTDDSVEPPLMVTEQAYAIFSSATPPPQHIPDSLLIGFATDSLEPMYAKTLAPHISSCAECSETVAHFRSIRLWFRQDDGQDPPSATLTHAYAILHNQRHGSMPWWRRVFYPIAFSSARRFAMALILVLFILSSVLAYTTVGNLVSTAHAAIPGDSLYSVKHEFEQMELATTWDTAGKLEKHIAYAGYRIDETAALIRLHRRVEIPATLAAFETETNLVVQTYSVLAKENVSRAQALGTKVQDALANHSDKLANLRDVANAGITPLLDHAIATADNNQKIVDDIFNQLPIQPAPSSLDTLTPTGVVPSATRVTPTLTGIPSTDVTATPALPLQNTPANIAPTSIPAVIETATPPVPTATSTPPILTPTATSTPPILAPTATSTPPVIAPTATSTPPVIAPTATSTPPVLAPTATSTSPVLAPTATSTSPVLAPTATPTIILTP